MKKYLLTVLLLFFLIPDMSYAFTIIENTNPGAFTNPVYDVYRNRYISTWDKATVESNTLTSYSDSTYTVQRTIKTFSDQGNPKWKDFAFGCNTFYKMESFDKSGKKIGELRFEATQIINPDPNVCNSMANGDDGTGTEGTAPCDVCEVFECPAWDLHLQKLDDIKNAIPPPPNWHQVSQIFSDAIVPRLVGETRTMLSDLLGMAPEPPPVAPDLPKLNDHNFESKKPTMLDVPGLEGFTENDVKKSAPVIPFEDDPTGGFNLSVDPIDNLPDVVPGGDPGIYKRDPKESPAQYPGKPADKNVDMGNAPKPSDNTGTPPIPGSSGGSPPTPGGGAATPPTPSGTNPYPGSYKPSP